MKYAPVALMLMLLAAAVALVALAGCSDPSPKTRIDPASVHLVDKFQDKGPGARHETHIQIAPPAPARRPPATMPAVAPPLQGGTVTITQSTPITVDVGGKKVTAPAGSSVSIDSDDTDTPPETTHDASADAAGPTLVTSGDAGSFKADAPTVGLSGIQNEGAAGGGSKGGGGKGSGGATSDSWTAIVKAVSSASTGELVCWLVGIGLILAAVGMIIAEHIFRGATDWALVLILGGGGFLFIVLGLISETHPTLAIVLGILGLVSGVGGYVLWWKFGKTPAVTAAVSTVESKASSLLGEVETHLGIAAAASSPKAMA